MKTRRHFKDRCEQPVFTQGRGHSGFGWYVHEREYPEEGAFFLKHTYPRAAALDRQAIFSGAEWPTTLTLA